MYKLVVLTALLAVATAAPGLIGAPALAPWGHGYGVAPAYVSAPIVKAAVPVATSYANTVRIATPAVVAAHAPIAVAHAPVLAAPLAHGW
ncbi:larval/pupal cuticle protein H1C-like [Colias croceus]|uniref:larval/pupal cuticle protein H1C-like n=1 Tax=Colias crocea TaxID=72248 RepID=UPI001E27A4A2|nr:larval/pupal cuticle protein H1C-like [Colias croceus]